MLGRWDICQVQQGFVGSCFHVPCSKARILLSRVDKEEASLQSLSSVALIEVMLLDGAEVKRRRHMV